MKKNKEKRRKITKKLFSPLPSALPQKKKDLLSVSFLSFLSSFLVFSCVCLFISNSLPDFLLLNWSFFFLLHIVFFHLFHMNSNLFSLPQRSRFQKEQAEIVLGNFIFFHLIFVEFIYLLNFIFCKTPFHIQNSFFFFFFLIWPFFFFF